MEQVNNGIWPPNIPCGGVHSDEMRVWSHSFLSESHSHLETLFQGNILNVHKLVTNYSFTGSLCGTSISFNLFDLQNYYVRKTKIISQAKVYRQRN